MNLTMISLAAFCASFLLTKWVLRYSRIHQLVDLPNARSSHSVPTPRGGGLSIAAVTIAGAVVLCAMGKLAAAPAVALALGGSCIAAVGFWDDIRSAPIAVRMAVHIGAASLAVYCLGGAPALHVGAFVIDLGAAGAVLTVLAVVWAVNLYNFMDGIDGLAASEAAFVLLGGAALALILGGAHAAEAAPAFIAGAACLGFLALNWPPASIFMGDVGSGFLGYAIAVFAIEFSRTGAVNIYAWLILGGVFLTDATLTLFRRLLRGERVYQAHRTHAYQWTARRWKSHGRVTTAVILVDVFWLLPCAALAMRFTALAPWICALALVPLGAAALWGGSGRPEVAGD
jgi:Fuc2NAc and GlcNAc transferase